MMHDLFTYPTQAGYKADGPSREAAESVSAATLRTKVLGEIMRAPATADECAARLGLSPFSARPRFSELRNMGLISDTGQRRRNSSGRSATVWAAR